MFDNIQEKLLERIYNVGQKGMPIKESTDLFSKIETIPLEIISPDELGEDFALLGASGISKKKSADDVTAALDRIENSPQGSKSVRKHDSIGLVHPSHIHGGKGKDVAKRIIGIKNQNGVGYNLEALKNRITQRPTEILKANEKMQHGTGQFVQFYNIGLPALKALVYDEKDNQFVVVNTCPGAGKCTIDCYALHGNFIMVPNSALSRARTLNFILNDPDGFKNMLIREIKSKRKKISKGIDVNIRWHDAGDFFAPAYLKIAIDIAEQFPDILFYAYTKMASAALSNLPPNFLMRFSAGANEKNTQAAAGSDYQAETVPKALFLHLFETTPSKKIRRGSDDKWIFKAPVDKSIKELKKVIANHYKLDINTILMHDEYMKNKGSLSKEKKYNVIIIPGDSDFPAKERNVARVFNLEH